MNRVMLVSPGESAPPADVKPEPVYHGACALAMARESYEWHARMAQRWRERIEELERWTAHSDR